MPASKHAGSHVNTVFSFKNVMACELYFKTMPLYEKVAEEEEKLLKNPGGHSD